MIAYLYIQCEHKSSDRIGCFITSSPLANQGEILSPVFPFLHETFAWLKANGWKQSTANALQYEKN